MLPFREGADDLVKWAMGGRHILTPGLKPYPRLPAPKGRSGILKTCSRLQRRDRTRFSRISARRPSFRRNSKNGAKS